MISVNVDGKDGIVTLSDGNEVITPKISDLINAKYDAEYVDAVKKEITKEQAKAALNQINRLTPELEKTN